MGETVTFGYDNRVTAPTAMTSSLTGNPVCVAGAVYNPLGQLTSATHGTGRTVGSRTFTYDASTNRLATQTGVTGGVTRLNRSYAYDNASNLTRVLDALDSNQRTCYRYDDLWRFAEAFTSNADTCNTYTAVGTAPFDHDYTYSPIGNLTSSPGPEAAPPAPAPTGRPDPSVRQSAVPARVRLAAEHRAAPKPRLRVRGPQAVPVAGRVVPSPRGCEVAGQTGSSTVGATACCGLVTARGRVTGDPRITCDGPDVRVNDALGRGNSGV